MAETGINIRVADTVLGSPPNVNANTMMIFPTPRLTPGTVVTSPQDEVLSGLDPYYLGQIKRFFNPAVGIDNIGIRLSLDSYNPAQVTDADKFVRTIVNSVKRSVSESFSNRPRQVGVMFDETTPWIENTLSKLNEVALALDEAASALRSESINVVFVLGIADGGGVFLSSTEEWENLFQKKSPFVGVVATGDADSYYSDVGSVLGYLASVSVGVSIGDASLPPIKGEQVIISANGDPVTDMSSEYLSLLSEAQVIFARTRPPRNSLWWNDGATLNDPQNALSTLEAARTLCSVVDDLRLFFTNYINTRVPVAANGDIDPTYKQVVLDNARAKVITPYIESGDISDARIELVAKNNNMVSTRTWEVKVSILPAPTLRWIDGFVFYVNSL